MSQKDDYSSHSTLGTIIRIVLLAIAVFAIFYGLNALLDWASMALSPSAMIGLLLLILAVYVLLIAIPFVPGIEIAISLMILNGKDYILPIYAATIVGLMLAYGAGRLMPYSWLHRVFQDLRLKRACILLEKLEPMSKEERLHTLRDRLPAIIRKLFVDWRYAMIAVTLNIPGNALIGGGGGILMIAGLSRTFSFWGILLTLIIAASPIPLAILLFDASPIAIFRK